MDKIKVFKTELSYIRDPKIRKSAETMIDLLPEYFFHEAASSTGKYHPAFALGEGGLVRHVKVATRIAKELFGIYKFDDETKDLIIFAILIHDGLKRGLEESRYTKFDHPLLIAKYLRESKDKLELTDEQVERIAKMDESHMGKWNTSDYDPGIVLPIPKTVEEKFVHMCDFLSSKKFMHIDFDQNNDIQEDTSVSQ